jgi:hypothetical protein
MMKSNVRKEVLGRQFVLIAALVALCTYLAPSVTQAESTEDERGFFLGLTLEGTSFHSDVASSAFNIKQDGGGAQVSFGYRFNPVFMLELSAGGASHKTSDTAIDAQVVLVQILGYYRFLPEKSIRPYLKGGIGGYGLNLTYGSASAKMSGGGIVFGGGFRCFLSRRFSLGADLTHNMIRFDKASISLGQLSYESNTDEHARLTSLGITAGYSF